MVEPAPKLTAEPPSADETVPAVLSRVTACRRESLESRAAFLEALRQARAEGLSLRRIGEAAGMTGTGVLKLLQRHG